MSDHAFQSHVRQATLHIAARALLDELRTCTVEEGVNEKANALADVLHAFEGVGHSVSDGSDTSDKSDLWRAPPFPGDMERCELEQGGNPHAL